MESKTKNLKSQKIMFVIQAAGDLYKKNKKHRIQVTIIYNKIEKIQKSNTINS